MTKKLLIVAIVLCMSVASAQAAYFYDWNTQLSTSLVDPTDVPEIGRDIVKLWWAYDDTNHYFRMDLEEAPTLTEYSMMYGIYINFQAGGTYAGLNHPYVPTVYEPLGIDFIVDMHYNATVGMELAHLDMWQPATNNFDLAYLAQDNWQTLDAAGNTVAKNPGGSTIEWRVPIATLTDVYGIGGGYCMWGATHDDTANKVTYDTTESFCTPEPGTWALMGLGLLGVLAMRRRKQA